MNIRTYTAHLPLLLSLPSPLNSPATIVPPNSNSKTLSPCIQDIGEARQFLSFLNGRTAFLVAVVMFNFGAAGILGEGYVDGVGFFNTVHTVCFLVMAEILLVSTVTVVVTFCAMYQPSVDNEVVV